MNQDGILLCPNLFIYLWALLIGNEIYHQATVETSSVSISTSSKSTSVPFFFAIAFSYGCRSTY
ncbi:uncharacterized protein K452DRAFT_292747 [Aplosporella prunicola CBS 121167]|uniref:Uncharacterized protein n=1 Tax=Aplosporella prunicola CBS 121167 TaxID=1176127 RepID=A0A6A6AZ17_9PEZI|nr:uncharacterized protein K452DRAFT_292747 [Aplosporella prunicola CBS 121167]KAF2136027.1 hypothetical protein K452DRAFT_292747 [Aplosporella prunicola CBS 121167]